MTIKNNSSDSFQDWNSSVDAVQCLNDVLQAWTTYVEICETEQTKRRAIEAWEKTTIETIQAKRDFLIGYLERSFDERAMNFQALFQVVDQAIVSGNNQQLGLTLNAITELAKTSPFKDLADLSAVQAALDDPDHLWEF